MNSAPTKTPEAPRSSTGRFIAARDRPWHGCTHLRRQAAEVLTLKRAYEPNICQWDLFYSRIYLNTSHVFLYQNILLLHTHTDVHVNIGIVFCWTNPSGQVIQVCPANHPVVMDNHDLVLKQPCFCNGIPHDLRNQ